jgi:hypothetical protein
MKRIPAVLLFFLIYSCAIQIPPDGGLKDIKPPELISSEPENFSVNVRPSIIKLNFNEFIQLKDINTQLVVSPPLKFIPESSVRKNIVKLELKDTLEANTTYTMNFGSSITDLNEGNALPDFQYVFSTGTIIDSLIISGRIQMASNLKSEKNILTMLYRNSDDSLPFKKLPSYFARTDDSGKFVVRNISPGRYKVFALKESDGNYLYNGGDELVGYSDSLVTAGSDKVKIELFPEVPVQRILKSYSEFPGKAAVVFSVPMDTMDLQWITDTNKLNIYSINYSANRDTLSIWYKNTTADSMAFILKKVQFRDTVSLRLFRNDGQAMKKQPFKLSLSAEDKGVSHDLYKPFNVIANHPLIHFDSSAITLLEDSIPVTDLKISYGDSLRLILSFNHAWKDGKKYILFIPPSGLTDIYDLKNDTTRFEFVTHSESDYGSLEITFDAISSGQKILQLIDEKEIVYRNVTFINDTAFTFNYLLPNLYRIKLINDENKNGRWDTGNYLKHIQPEKVSFYQEAITVRANWDVEVLFKEEGNVKEEGRGQKAEDR